MEEHTSLLSVLLYQRRDVYRRYVLEALSSLHSIDAVPYDRHTSSVERGPQRSEVSKANSTEDWERDSVQSSSSTVQCHE